MNVLPLAYIFHVYVSFKLYVAPDIALICGRGSVIVPARLKQVYIKETFGLIVEFYPEFNRGFLIKIFERSIGKACARVNIVFLAKSI